MWEILENLLDTVLDLLEPVRPYLPSAVAGLLLAAVLIRFGGALIIRTQSRLRQRMSRRHFAVKSALLALPSICEMYAPARLYTTEKSEEEQEKKGMKLAWLSPYPRAVKASFKRNRVPKSERLEARRQVADAASHVQVLPIPASEDDPSEHYLITLQLDGHDPAEFRKLEGKVKGQLGLRLLQEHETSDAYSISFQAHTTEPTDSLVELKAGGEFFEQHPAKTPYSLPLALKSNGQAWSLPTHHTLIFGMTGSGKGSAVHGIIRQLAPFVEAGRCVLYGVDPKASELRPYADTSLFREVVYETDESQEVISSVHKLMKHRAATKRVDLQKAELGRSLDATRETPMVVLVIDELLSLLIALKALGRAGAATMTLLTEVLAQGRSLGVYVVAATQAVDAELLGRTRVNFANMILLRQDNLYYNDLFLGEKAAERGFNSVTIPASSRANGYAYAGVGYVKEEGGDPVKVRFAYTSDQELADLCLRFSKTGEDEWLWEEAEEDAKEPQRVPLTKKEAASEGDELPDLTDFL